MLPKINPLELMKKIELHIESFVAPCSGFFSVCIGSVCRTENANSFKVHSFVTYDCSAGNKYSFIASFPFFTSDFSDAPGENLILLLSFHKNVTSQMFFEISQNS